MLGLKLNHASKRDPNNITKDRCPIPMDTTVRLGPLKFSLQATKDHGPSIDSGHYTASINCCKKTFYCNDHKITEFGTTDKNSSTAYIVLYKWIDTWFFDSNRRVGVWSLPWRWHILSIPLTTGRGTSAETCGLDDVFPPDDLGSRPEALCWYICIYICMYIPYTSSVIGRIYNGSVIQYWRSCTPSRSIGECAVPGLNATFCFLWFTNCVLLFDKNLILGCLWLLVFVSNNILKLGIWCPTIVHLPGCYCAWTFFENIGFNTVLMDPFFVTSSYSTWIFCRGVFKLCNWLSLRCLVSWINHLLPACWSIFWKSNFKKQLGCRFDIMDNESYFFVFWHMQLYMSWYIRSFFGFTFLNILYFFKYSCTNIFL